MNTNAKVAEDMTRLEVEGDIGDAILFTYENMYIKD